jgi:hypothetical protein
VRKNRKFLGCRGKTIILGRRKKFLEPYCYLEKTTSSFKEAVKEILSCEKELFLIFLFIQRNCFTRLDRGMHSVDG